MSLLDAIVCVIILFFTWKGYKNGLVKEVFRIVGVVIAGFLAFQYANVMGGWIGRFFNPDPEYLPFLSFAVLFLVAISVVQSAIYVIDSLIQLLLLSIPNRILGSLFGAAKSTLLLSFVFIFLAGFHLPDKQHKTDSVLYSHVMKAGPVSYDMVARVLPGVKPYRDSIENYIVIPVDMADDVP